MTLRTRLSAFAFSMMIACFGTSANAQLIDDFSSGDLSAYTNTVVLKASGTGGVYNTEAWTSTATPGELLLSTTVYDGIQQMAFVRNDFSLNDGDELQADFSNPQVGTGRNLGLFLANAALVTGTHDGTAVTLDGRSDYLAVHSIVSNGRVQARYFDGTSEMTSGAFTPVGTDPFETYFIKRVSSTSYEIGLYDDGNREVLSAVTLTNPNEANFLGFYADVRAAGDLGTVDNLRIVAVPEPSSFALIGLGCFLILGLRRR